MISSTTTILKWLFKILIKDNNFDVHVFQNFTFLTLWPLFQSKIKKSEEIQIFAFLEISFVFSVKKGGKEYL